MAYLKSIIQTCDTTSCRSRASQELFNRFNANCGQYCRACALRNLARLKKEEECDRGQSKTENSFLNKP